MDDKSTILIIDDEKPIRGLMGKLLERHSFNVLEVDLPPSLILVSRVQAPLT